MTITRIVMERLRLLAPTHTQTVTAQMLGVTRQAVWEMARRKGITFWRFVRPHCACGQLLHGSCVAAGLCNHCRAISRIKWYICSTCGRPFSLTRPEQTQRFSHVRKAPGVYCSKSCFARRPHEEDGGALYLPTGWVT